MYRHLFIAALSVASILGTTMGSAQGTGGGTIYYEKNGGMFAMDSNGGNLTALPAGVRGDPSRGLHGGARWFLFRQWIDGETYPDGEGRQEFCVIRGDGLVTVQLTNQPDLQISNVVWKPGDSFSCVARRWLGGVVIEGGIYTAEFAHDDAGNITGLAAQPGTPLIASALILDGAGNWRPNMNFHDWSPDGQRVVYNNATTEQLWVANLSSAHTQIYTGRWANTPAWSPAGTKIAFMSGFGGISSINPDGSGVKEIIKRTPQYGFGDPHWSPTGSHLTYYGLRTSGGPQYDIFRSSATGSGKSNLTNTGYPFNEYPINWR